MHVYDTARVRQEVDDPHRARTGGQRPTMTATPIFGPPDPNGGWWTPVHHGGPAHGGGQRPRARRTCHMAVV